MTFIDPKTKNKAYTKLLEELIKLKRECKEKGTTELEVNYWKAITELELLRTKICNGRKEFRQLCDSDPREVKELEQKKDSVEKSTRELEVEYWKTYLWKEMTEINYANPINENGIKYEQLSNVIKRLDSSKWNTEYSGEL